MTDDDRREDPPAEAGYWHGSATGMIAALRKALEPLAKLADDPFLSGAWRKDDTDLLVVNLDDEVRTKLTLGDARRARAALNHGRPPTREELKAGGAKEISGSAGLTHTDKDKL